MSGSGNRSQKRKEISQYWALSHSSCVAKAHRAPCASHQAVNGGNQISLQFREMSIVTSAGIVILIGEKAFVERFASNCFLSGQN